MNLDVSRESLRVLEQEGTGSGWGLGKTTWQPSEGNTAAGRPETGSHQEGGRSGAGEAEGDSQLCGQLWACPFLGPGHYSPWIPIMCSRMRTLSARIFKASRSCCTPSPWQGGNSQGQGRSASLYMLSPLPPRPSCHHHHYNSHHPLCARDAV